MNLKSFESLNEVNKLIKALENTFIIDENLTINKVLSYCGVLEILIYKSK